MFEMIDTGRSVIECQRLWGGAVAVTVVVGGFLSAGVSAVQHYHLCWHDLQCETDPSLYPYLVMFSRLCVVHCNSLFLFVSLFVYSFLSVI